MLQNYNNVFSTRLLRARKVPTIWPNNRTTQTNLSNGKLSCSNTTKTTSEVDAHSLSPKTKKLDGQSRSQLQISWEMPRRCRSKSLSTLTVDIRLTRIKSIGRSDCVKTRGGLYTPSMTLNGVIAVTAA